MKKGIALLLTLSFILISIGIVSSIFIFYHKISSNSFEYSIAEDSLIVDSVANTLKKIKIEDKNDVEKLLNSSYSVAAKNFDLIATIIPENNRLNINKFWVNKKENSAFSDTFDNVCQINKIKNCEYLKSLILDTLDTDEYERMDDTEIKKSQPFQNGIIKNYSQLNIISKYYYKHTSDKNIFNLKWNQFFSLESNYLDCDIMSQKTAKLLNIDTENPNCRLVKSLFSDYFLKKLGIMPFNKKSNFYVNVKVEYNFHSKHILNVLYDMKNKRIIKIEKHFIY